MTRKAKRKDPNTGKILKMLKIGKEMIPVVITLNSQLISIEKKKEDS